MNDFEEGTIIKFSDGRDFGVTNAADSKGKRYLCLATIEEPLEIVFAEVSEGKLRIITESGEKQQILPLFANRPQ